MSNDAIFNLGESNEVVPWDDGNESNELVDDPSDDDVDVDEDALNRHDLRKHSHYRCSYTLRPSSTFR